GLLYWHSSPDSPALVKVGSTIKAGDTVALIEVMKCFYPLKYESGPKRIVKKLCIVEGQAVLPGQQILIFEN
ncbi:MAG: acetyl-CoA carboxylase biotin carboxyl carrier protein, partial [bacterium]|nr:acetyl-CoA carboxylase biotin carboxyl carrier protein [bacterium]